MNPSCTKPSYSRISPYSSLTGTPIFATFSTASSCSRCVARVSAIFLGTQRVWLLARRDSVVEMSHVLYSRIFKNRRLLRSNPEEEEKASKRVAEGNYSIFDIDAECE